MPAQKTTENKNAAATKLAKFNQLRQKAIDAGVAIESNVAQEPFTLGEDYGFENPIEAKVPSLETTLILQRAISAGDVVDQAVALFGNVGADRLVKALDKEFDAAAGSQILAGIILSAYEHFWGRDAGEVAGGFTS